MDVYEFKHEKTCMVRPNLVGSEMCVGHQASEDTDIWLLKRQKIRTGSYTRLTIPTNLVVQVSVVTGLWLIKI